MGDSKSIKGNQDSRHGGKRPGAGRKPGSVTRKTRETAERAIEQGITPLEVMLTAMRSAFDAGELKEAASFAKDAAPYMHARLANVQAEVSGPNGGPVETVTRIELTAMHGDSTH